MGVSERASKRGLLGSCAALVGQGPPEGDWVVWKESDGVASGPEAGAVQGARDVLVVELGVWADSPQVCGVRSGARGPSKRSTFKSSKGSWGFCSKTLVIWPVTGSVMTLPGSLITTPVSGSLTAM